MNFFNLVLLRFRLFACVFLGVAIAGLTFAHSSTSLATVQYSSESPVPESSRFASPDDARRLLEAELAQPKYERVFPEKETYFQRLISRIDQIIVDFVSSMLVWVGSLSRYTDTRGALLILIATALIALYLLFKAFVSRFSLPFEPVRKKPVSISVPHTEEDVRRALESGDLRTAFRIVLILLSQMVHGVPEVSGDSALTNHEIALAVAREAPEAGDTVLRAVRTADLWFYANRAPTREEGSVACVNLLNAYRILRLRGGPSTGNL
ncbi:MAG: hypothetical protein V2G42_05330 [bacterium JZ-2024 1]